MKKKYHRSVLKAVILFLIISCNIHSFAQYGETIRSDRPGQANTPYAVGKKVFQLQTGVDFGGIRLNQTKYSEFYASSTVLRFGVLKKMDLNLGVDFRKDQITNSNFSGSGLSSFLIGTRINLIEENDKAPAIGFQFGINLPILSLDYAIDKAAPRFTLILSKSFNDHFGINFNAGFLNTGVSSQPIGIYVANFNFAINEKLGFFIEAYGYYNRLVIQNYFDFGLAFISNSNLQLDFYSGIASVNGQVNYFGSVGVSVRMGGNKE